MDYIENIFNEDICKIWDILYIWGKSLSYAKVKIVSKVVWLDWWNFVYQYTYKMLDYDYWWAWTISHFNWWLPKENIFKTKPLLIEYIYNQSEIFILNRISLLENEILNLKKYKKEIDDNYDNRFITKK